MTNDKELKTFATTVRMDARQVADAVKFLEHFGARIKNRSDIFRESLKTLQQLGLKHEILTPLESTEEAIIFLQEHDLMTTPDKSTQEQINKAITLESLDLHKEVSGVSGISRKEESSPSSPTPQGTHAPAVSSERMKRIQEQFNREQEEKIKERSLRRHSESGDEHYVDDSKEDSTIAEDSPKASLQRAKEAEERNKKEKEALMSPPQVEEE